MADNSESDRDKRRDSSSQGKPGASGSPPDFAAGKRNRGPLRPEDYRQEAREKMAVQKNEGVHRRTRIDQVVQECRDHRTEFEEFIRKVPVSKIREYCERVKEIQNEVGDLERLHVDATRYLGLKFMGGIGRDRRNRAEIGIREGVFKLAALIAEMKSAAQGENVEAIESMQNYVQNYLGSNSNTEGYGEIQEKYSNLSKINALDVYADEMRSIYQNVRKKNIEERQLWVQETREIRTYIRELLEQTKKEDEFRSEFLGLEVQRGEVQKMENLYKGLVQQLFEKDEMYIGELLGELLEEEYEHGKKAWDTLKGKYEQLLQYDEKRKIDHPVEARIGIASSSHQDSNTIEGISPYDSIPYQLQRTYHEVKTLRGYLMQEHFNRIKEVVSSIMGELSDREVPREECREIYDDIVETYRGAFPGNLTSHEEGQEAFDAMGELHKNLLVSAFNQTENFLSEFNLSQEQQEHIGLLTEQFQSPIPRERQKALEGMRKLHESLLGPAFEQVQKDAEALLGQLADPQREDDSAGRKVVLLDGEPTFGHDLYQDKFKRLGEQYQDKLKRLGEQYQESSTTSRGQAIYMLMRELKEDLQQANFEKTQRCLNWLEAPQDQQMRIQELEEQFQSSSPHERQKVLDDMREWHKGLLDPNFEQTHKAVSDLLEKMNDPIQAKREFDIDEDVQLTQLKYQNELNDLRKRHQESSKRDIRQWQEGVHEITTLHGTIANHALIEQLERIHDNIDTVLQDLQEDIATDEYQTEYEKLKQNYELGTLDAGTYYREMGLFYAKLLMANKMNIQKQEIEDDAKEKEYYMNDMEMILQRHTRRAQRVWSNEQGEIFYAQFTDLEGNEHPKEVVEAVNGTDTKTGKAVQGYYCSKTQHFIASDQTVYDAQLIGDQQLILKGREETPYECQLRQWARPADTEARRELEEAQKKIWQVLSSRPELFGLTLDSYGSYISKTTIPGSDADIHVVFNNTSINNPFYNDPSKYREIMNNALIEAFTKDNIAIHDTVTIIDKKAFGTATDVSPAFAYTTPEGVEGSISFTNEKEIITQYPKEKHKNAQEKSEGTAYYFRSLTRVSKSMRTAMLRARHAKSYDELEESQQMPSSILEAAIYNTPNEHIVDYTLEGKPIRRDLPATFDRVLAHCVEQTATDEACKEWKKVDGIQYLFNHDANTPREMELNGVIYTNTGKYDIPRQTVHDFLKQLQEYIKEQKEQQEGPFQSIQLSQPLVGPLSS